jgi:hypothetical protein
MKREGLDAESKGIESHRARRLTPTIADSLKFLRKEKEPVAAIHSYEEGRRLAESNLIQDAMRREFIIATSKPPHCHNAGESRYTGYRFRS